MKTTKLTLQIDDTIVIWEKDGVDHDFNTLLTGFLSCMWGQTYVPGTEIHCFKDYIAETEELYVDSLTQQDQIESRRLEID